MKLSATIIAGLTSGVILIGCSTPSTNAVVDPIGPDRASFPPVAEMLVKRCGTLDCHGTTGRNLRLYGYGGLRLAPSALPDDDVTPAEVDANYEAVVALEPERMRDVVLAKGADPSRLTLVRKARGEEEHKGGSLIVRDDAADRCLLSWLASSTDTGACAQAIEQP